MSGGRVKNASLNGRFSGKKLMVVIRALIKEVPGREKPPLMERWKTGRTGKTMLGLGGRKGSKSSITELAADMSKKKTR